MDDTTPANDSNEQGLNKIDLTQLQTFSFGTQWSEVKPVSPQRRDFDREPRERRDDGGGHGAPARDRRAFRKPAGPATGAPGAGAPTGGEGQGQGPGPGGAPRRFDRGPGPGGPRRDFRGGENRGGDRRESAAPFFDRAPYVSPYFMATCYPEDTGFAAMVKAVRASCRTYQLFEITKAVLEKNDRFVIVVQRTKAPTSDRPAEGEAAAAAAKPASLFMSMPDHLPFETEEAAIQHVMANHLAQYFDVQEVEIEPPKGNFPIINKCGITGELLGPPNYHRYQQFIQQHHATRLDRMSFDKFRDSIISVREPEVLAQWQEKMKKAVRYIWKTPAPVVKTPSTPPMPAVGTAAAAPGEATPAAAADAPVAEAATTPEAAPVVETPAAEAPAALSFDSFEDARFHLLDHARERVVRAVETVRFHGKVIEKLAPGEIRRAVEGHVERQRRFPLDTANALRGRLRREGFTIFKKGSRGVSFVCAVKRRFRVPGQVFSETITALIDFIEKNPMVHVKDLPKNFLLIDIAAAMAAAPAPVEGVTVSQAPFAALPQDQADRLRKMGNDLRWLVMEGYVTEFSDGKLFAAPPMAPQSGRKSDEHGEEHDPVDFPDAPAPVAAAPETAQQEAPSAPIEATVAETAPTETLVAETSVTDVAATEAPTVEIALPEAPKAEGQA